MKRIFLSLGFRGKGEERILNEIDKMKEKITSYYPNEELEFVHNYFYQGNNRVECLGEALKKMSTCDIVYFLTDDLMYNIFKGCHIEKKVCEIYNITHKFISID